MAHTDIQKLHWVIRFLPEFARPYAYLARLDRPIGVWLLLLPAFWSIMLASGGIMNFNVNDLRLLVLFAIGAVVMRAAGCVVNDLWDRKLDAKVERTAQRPLASGDVSVKSALVFLCILLLIGLLILSRLSIVAILLGFLVAPLIAAYPLMKRWTWWPQAFLGITFNFGALMGWAAVTGILELPALLLYFAGIFWTLGYDTIYAIQDKEDDALIGIKSLALKLGEDTAKWLKIFYAISFVLLIGAFFTAGAGVISLAALALCGGHFYLQIKDIDLEDKAEALAKFKSNRNAGLLVLLAAAV